VRRPRRAGAGGRVQGCHAGSGQRAAPARGGGATGRRLARPPRRARGRRAARWCKCGAGPGALAAAGRREPRTGVAAGRPRGETPDRPRPRARRGPRQRRDGGPGCGRVWRRARGAAPGAPCKAPIADHCSVPPASPCDRHHPAVRPRRAAPFGLARDAPGHFIASSPSRTQALLRALVEGGAKRAIPATPTAERRAAAAGDAEKDPLGL
jgi:hypothetical protein